MGMSAWVFGIIGGLCAVMGIITATGVISEYAGLTWMFWMVLSGILLLTSIAFSVGRGGGEGYEQLGLSAVSISRSEAKISLRVYPNASRNEMVGFTDGVLWVKSTLS